MVDALGGRFRSLPLVGSIGFVDEVDIGLEAGLDCCGAWSCAGELPL